jgi:hypothetical protein
MNQYDDPIIHDNFLDNEDFQILKQILVYDFQWNFSPNIASEKLKDPRKNYGFGFTIVNEEESEYYEKVYGYRLIKRLNDKIKNLFNFTKVLRCRLDMTTYRGDSEIILDPHTDLDGEHYTSIFYINDSNAPTIIYNEKLLSGEYTYDMKLTEKRRVYPRQNRLVVYNGNLIHTGMCPMDSPFRILINSNFI